MKTLKEIKQSKTAVVSFGRMNPPTIGHEKLIKTVQNVARSRSADPFVYVSQTQDSKKNPLSHDQKIKYLKLGVPGADNIVKNDSNIKTIFDAMVRLIDLGYKHIILVVGQDRVKEFEKVITPYINHPDKSKSLELSKFEIVSAGDRDPDSEGIAGMSASKMRDAAIKNNFDTFKLGVPSKLSVRFAKEMFDAIRKALI